jgi:hypothetical protein
VSRPNTTRKVCGCRLSFRTWRHLMRFNTFGTQGACDMKSARVFPRLFASLVVSLCWQYRPSALRHSLTKLMHNGIARRMSSFG